MRKGYWKTLLRRLRGRVASGADTFLFQQVSLTVVDILASDDDALDPAGELPLAALSDGTKLLVDTGSNLVLWLGPDLAPAESTGLDLPAFVDALVSASESGLALGDAETVHLPLSGRRHFLDD